MTHPPTTDAGLLLWRLLPLVYRRWDGVHGKDPKHPIQSPQERGDLARLLDGFGLVLDEIRNTLEQRLLDTDPERCQEWLVPYFADLLDVRLVSPEIEGQRLEVARAVGWRQRKGTSRVTTTIARDVGRFLRVVPQLATPDRFAPTPAVVLHEGFRRVVTTVRIDRLLPTPRQLSLPTLRQLGLPADTFHPSGSPVSDALHPGLPAGTADFRRLSRARQTTRPTAQSRVTAFGDREVRWQVEHPRGIPCHLDTYQDHSARTVDVRTPSWRHGHHHPRRVLVYTEPHAGFFRTGAPIISWEQLQSWFGGFASEAPPFSDWEDRPRERVRERILPVPGGGAVLAIERELQDRDGTITRERIVALEEDDHYRGRDVWRVSVLGDEHLLVCGLVIVDIDHPDQGRHRVLRGFGPEPVIVTSENDSFALSGLDGALPASASPPALYHLEDLAVTGELRVADAKLSTRRVAIERLVVESPDATTEGEPHVSLRDSLIGELRVSAPALVRLEYCSVLQTLDCAHLEASDCILLDPSRTPSSFDTLFLRYCCAPWLPLGELDPDTGRILDPSIVRIPPLVIASTFGQPGCGVLHPGAHASIRFGAEDGGELGAHHHAHHVLREEAAMDKLHEFLPVNQQPVLIPHQPWAPPLDPHES